MSLKFAVLVVWWLVVCWLAASTGAAKAGAMTASDIQARLIGQELCTPKSGGLFADLVFCFTYRRDGTFHMKSDEPGDVVNWAFEADQLCLYKLASPKNRSCASFEPFGESRFRVNGKDTVCLGPCED